MKDTQRPKVVQVFPDFVDNPSQLQMPQRRLTSFSSKASTLNKCKSNGTLLRTSRDPKPVAMLGDVDFAVLIWLKLVGLGAWFL